MQRERVAAELRGILAVSPGLNKRQLLKELHGRGFDTLTTTDVNSVLYGHRTTFVSDNRTPPAWSLSSAIEGIPGSQPLIAGTEFPLHSPRLYRGDEPRAWQREALAAWHAHGRKGVIEAVTGTGKTTVGVLAAAAAIDADERVLILVPSTDLLDQWYEVLRRDLRGASIGRFSGDHRDDLESHSILVSTVQSAHRYSMLPKGVKGVLIADEVHRYGAKKYSKALEPAFSARLGLTATYAREDNGVADFLDPYFGGVVGGCGYERALADGILARFKAAFVGVDFSPSEQERHDEWDEEARAARRELISHHGCPAEPFGEFMAAVNLLSEGGSADSRPTRVARRYLNAFSKRRQLLAVCGRKYAALQAMTPVLTAAQRGLVFTETKSSACQSVEVLRSQGVRAQDFTSTLTKRERKERLERFKRGDVQVLAAPRVLDEGIDVPQADVGVILGATRSRRQMIQRMGRIIRPKDDGRSATFIVLYVKGTVEDPALGAHEAFLDQLIDVAEDCRDFRSGANAPKLLKYLRADS